MSEKRIAYVGAHVESNTGQKGSLFCSRDCAKTAGFGSAIEVDPDAEPYAVTAHRMCDACGEPFPPVPPNVRGLV